MKTTCTPGNVLDTPQLPLCCQGFGEIYVQGTAAKCPCSTTTRSARGSGVIIYITTIRITTIDSTSMPMFHPTPRHSLWWWNMGIWQQRLGHRFPQSPDNRMGAREYPRRCLGYKWFSLGWLHIQTV